MLLASIIASHLLGARWPDFYYEMFQTYRKKFFFKYSEPLISYLDGTMLTFCCICSIICVYFSVFYWTIQKYGTDMITIPEYKRASSPFYLFVCLLVPIYF